MEKELLKILSKLRRKIIFVPDATSSICEALNIDHTLQNLFDGDISEVEALNEIEDRMFVVVQKRFFSKVHIDDD